MFLNREIRTRAKVRSTVDTISLLDYDTKWWLSGDMPVPAPVWDCSGLGPMDEALDTASVVSEDIWKKFDFDFPSDTNSDRTYEEFVIPELFYDKVTYLASEIRHHDCMWAGLCISKEHNRTLPAKKDSQPQKKVAAGRSLLISRASTSARSLMNVQQQQQQQQMLQQQQQQQQQQHQTQQTQQCRTKSLESDGDSTRPDTPPTSTSDTDTEEDEVPVFKHDTINIHEKLSECMSEPIIKAAPVSEVTGQLVRRMSRFYDRRKEDDNNQQQQQQQPNVRNTLSDHCYHLNQQPAYKRLDNLGVQTPSESEEEEIDVVTFEKPCRASNISNHSNANEQTQQQQYHYQQQQSTITKEKKSSTTASTTTQQGSVTTPRPRGRPPSNATRKRNAPASAPLDKPVKRSCQRSCQRRNKTSRSKGGAVGSKSSSEDELDTEKRSLHNNMERQRRVELRHYFEDLRRLVPAVEPKEKAAKVTILRQAALYCDTLSRINISNKAEISELSRRQELLRARLRYLRRSLALTR